MGPRHSLVTRAVVVDARSRSGGAADVGCVAAHLGRAGPKRVRVMGLNVGLRRSNELQIGRCLDGVVRVGSIRQVLVRACFPLPNEERAERPRLTGCNSASLFYTTSSAPLSALGIHWVGL